MQRHKHASIKAFKITATVRVHLKPDTLNSSQATIKCTQPFEVPALPACFQLPA